MSRSGVSAVGLSELDVLKEVERTHAKAWDVSANRLRKMWHVFGRVLRQQLLEGLGDCWEGCAFGVPGVGYWFAVRNTPDARPAMEFTFTTAFVDTYKFNYKPTPRKLPFDIKDVDFARIATLCRVDTAHAEAFPRAMFARLGELCATDFNVCLPHVGRFECSNRKPIFRFFGELLEIATPGGGLAAEAPRCVGDSRVIESVQKWLSESASRPKTSMSADARSAISSMSRRSDQGGGDTGGSQMAAMRRSPAVRRPQSGHVRGTHGQQLPQHSPQHSRGHVGAVRTLQQTSGSGGGGVLQKLASDGRGIGLPPQPGHAARRDRSRSPAKADGLMAEVAYSAEGRERVPKHALNTVMSEAYHRHAASLDRLEREDRKHQAFLRQKSREQEQRDRQMLMSRRDRMKQTSADLTRQVDEKVSRGDTPSFLKENVIPSAAGSEIFLPQEPLSTGRDRRSEQRQLCEALEAQIAERRTLERQQREHDRAQERAMLKCAKDQLVRDAETQLLRKRDAMETLTTSWQRQVAFGSTGRKRQYVR